MNQSDDKPLIIAHRGASALAPENTLAAFEKAIEDKAEGIEFDVRLTKDKVAVVFHDATLLRIAENKGRITSFSAEELKNFDIGSWFNKKHPTLKNPNFSKQQIPTLKETLEFLKDYKGVIYIELKCSQKNIKALSEAVCKDIKDSPVLPQIIVKSFKLDVLPNIQKHCPNAKTAVLFAPKVKTIIRKEKRLINIAKDLNADFLSLHFSLATKNLMRKAKDNNLEVAIWTADSPLWIKRSLKLGIKHIITNNPAILLAKRREIRLEN